MDPAGLRSALTVRTTTGHYGVALPVYSGPADVSGTGNYMYTETSGIGFKRSGTSSVSYATHLRPLGFYYHMLQVMRLFP